MTEQYFPTQHPDDGSIARYLDATVDRAERDRIENHLADCADCRIALGEITDILATRPRRRWMPLAPIMAAAAAVLVVVWSGSVTPDHAPRTRDPALTEALGPSALLPVGSVPGVDLLRWNAVPGAGRYRLNLFGTDGRVLWQATVTDTVVDLPDSVRLAPQTAYYWQVRAETGYGRWVESELTSFTVRDTARRR
jgi:hypothetical protein